MSEEVAQVIGDIAYWRQRAEQAEALARTLQSQRDVAEADLEALRAMALAYVISAAYEERARLRAELFALATKGGTQ